MFASSSSPLSDRREMSPQPDILLVQMSAIYCHPALLDQLEAAACMPYTKGIRFHCCVLLWNYDTRSSPFMYRPFMYRCQYVLENSISQSAAPSSEVLRSSCNCCTLHVHVVGKTFLRNVQWIISIELMVQIQLCHNNSWPHIAQSASFMKYCWAQYEFTHWSWWALQADSVLLRSDPFYTMSVSPFDRLTARKICF